jgi:Gpi18-like mannosyltransferase
MSAQATFDDTRGARGSAFLRSLGAAGPLPALAVTLGGLSLGFFLWYGLTTRLHQGPAGADLSFVLALVGGVALSLLGWYAYGRYFAQRAGIGLHAAMRWDSLSWALLGTYGLGFALPVSVFTPSRAAFMALALFALVKVFVAARFVTTVRDVLMTFVVTRVAIIVIAELASAMIGQRPGTHVAASSNPLLAVWGRWDAVHYLDIARRGYYGTDMAFFPLYPALIWLVGASIGSQLIAGLLISNAAFLFGLLFFYKLIEHQYNRTIARRAILYVSIFPTAFFFGAVYTEALFFALTVASFYNIREHKWLTAGVLGALAALTRVEGVLLFAPYVMEAFVPSGIGTSFKTLTGRLRSLRILTGALLIPLGLATYMAILWVLRGDPLYFSHVQSHWNRHLAPPWVSVWHTAHVMLTSHVATTVAGQALELGFTALMIGVLIGGFRRLRASFSAYMALSILVPMSTASLMSMPRFALVLFPMFAILAIWGGKSWVNNLIVAFSLPLLGLFTVLFADWYWVA